MAIFNTNVRQMTEMFQRKEKKTINARPDQFRTRV